MHCTLCTVHCTVYTDQDVSTCQSGRADAIGDSVQCTLYIGDTRTQCGAGENYQQFGVVVGGDGGSGGGAAMGAFGVEIKINRRVENATWCKLQGVLQGCLE